MCVCICDDIDVAMFVDKSIDTYTYNIEGIVMYTTVYKDEFKFACKGAYKFPSRGVGGRASIKQLQCEFLTQIPNTVRNNYNLSEPFSKILSFLFNTLPLFLYFLELFL